MKFDRSFFLALAVTAVLITFAAYGNGNHEQNSHEGNSSAGATSTTTANLDQTQAQSQNNSGNTQTIGFTTPDKTTIKNVPAVFAPNAYPTAPCRVAASGGIGFAGFGASGGGSKEDKECTRRETARMFWAFDQQEAALKLLCLSEVAQHDLADECGAMIPSLRAAAVGLAVKTSGKTVMLGGKELGK
jgi:hypothetical protein